MKTTKLGEPSGRAIMSFVDFHNKREFKAVYRGRNMMEDYSFTRVCEDIPRLATDFSLGDLAIKSVGETGMITFSGKFEAFSPFYHTYLPCGEWARTLKQIGLVPTNIGVVVP